MAAQGNPPAELKKLLVGSKNQLFVFSFDGSQFIPTGRYVQEDWLPSWVLFKWPNYLYAINPLDTNTSLLRIVPDYSPEGNRRRHNWGVDKSQRDIEKYMTRLYADAPIFASRAQGSHGGVHLAFNADKTRIVEASFFSGRIDIWDSSAADGSLRLMKSLSIPYEPSPGQNQNRPHQAVIDPTNRYFVIPDFGSDRLLIIDSQNDDFEIIGSKRVPLGSGPRHVAFLTNRGTHYLAVVAELSSQLFFYETHYEEDHIWFRALGGQHTYPLGPDNCTSRPAELVVSRDQRSVYVSNRGTDKETDHIARFAFSDFPPDHEPHLDYIGRTMTGGKHPRSFCLSNDPQQKYVFITNETGRHGLQVNKRDPQTGHIDPTPIATMMNRHLTIPGLEGEGPHFVCEI